MIIGIDATRAFYPKRTGTENYSYQLIQNLADLAKDHQLRLYVKEEPQDKEYQRLAKSANVEYKVIRIPRLWTQLGLATEIILRPPDVLFVPAHTIPILKRPGQKTVATVHDLGAKYLEAYHKFPQRLYLNKTTEYVAKYATTIIAVSNTTKQDLMQELNVTASKIKVIYEAYDKDRFFHQDSSAVQPVLNKYQIKQPYFLFVGTIQPRKNLKRLIEAYFSYYQTSTKTAKRSDIPRLYLAGKSGWLNSSIYDAPAKYNLKNQIKFLDYIQDEDLPLIYSGAQAFAYPSLYEGFGLPILEAMACGTPVLTSNRSSMSEIAGNAAYLVNPDDTNAITQGLYDLSTNAKLRQELISKGQKRVLQFSWQKCAKETLEVLIQTAQKK